MPDLDLLAGWPTDNIWHIEPVNDLKPHDCSVNSQCWCDPAVEIDGDCVLVIHVSADGREDFENGRRKRS